MKTIETLSHELLRCLLTLETVVLELVLFVIGLVEAVVEQTVVVEEVVGVSLCL